MRIHPLLALPLSLSAWFGGFAHAALPQGAPATFVVATPDEFIAAEASALPGDRIEMLAGSYPFAGFQVKDPKPFEVDVAVTIVAVGGTVSIQAEHAAVSSPFPGHALILDGLGFYPAPQPYPQAAQGGGLTVEPGAGTVWLLDCEGQGGSGSAGLTVQQANVAVQAGSYAGRSAVSPAPFQFGTTPGLIAQDSTLTLQDVLIRGGSGKGAVPYFSSLVPASPGSHGAEISRCQVHFSSCEVSGGDGGDGYYAFYASCAGAAPAGDAIHFTDSSSSHLNIRDTPLQGGLGGEQVVGCYVPENLHGEDIFADPFPPIDAAFWEFRLLCPSKATPGSEIEVGVESVFHGGPGSSTPANTFLFVSASPAFGLATWGGTASFIGPTAFPIPISLGLPTSTATVKVPLLPASTPYLTVYVQAWQVHLTTSLSTPMALTIHP